MEKIQNTHLHSQEDLFEVFSQEKPQTENERLNKQGQKESNLQINYYENKTWNTIKR